ncbi:MAG: efflux RND transporter periplasmic adaptor subunit [Alphaproteobacteria bacterium]|nr:efflux RND transporter periplasmic adaptor subunit [Alphaproteobacteria bacterium]
MKNLLNGLLACLAGIALGGTIVWQMRSPEGVAHTGASAIAPLATPPVAEKKPLYYRNPMGLPDVSPVPKKDWMGMDYIPVYEGEETGDDGAVRVSPARVQTLGVRTARVGRRMLTRPVRATASFQFDERRRFDVTLKYDGWIEGLLVATEGERVRAGQALFDIYSPRMLQAQSEYTSALKMLEEIPTSLTGSRADAERLLATAERALANLDLPDELLQRLREGRAPLRHIRVRAPRSGVVVENRLVQGMEAPAGTRLYRIADDTVLWLVAEVFEQDIALARVGQEVGILVSAFPGERFTGRIGYVYPSIRAETRTARVRIDVANPHGRLKVDMFAEAEFMAQLSGAEELAVPDSALLETGRRQIVIVQKAPGSFEPRPVRTGARGDGHVAILGGLQEGEEVVVQANFLIDAESNLKAALNAFGAVAGEAKQ